MQRTLRTGVLHACAAAAGLLLTVSIASAETFTATASVKTAAGGSGSTSVTFVVNQFSTDAERDALLAAVKKGGTAARDLLKTAKDLGTVQVFDKTTPIKYAYSRSMGASRLITIVTAEPVHFVTAGMTEQKPKAGYDLALAVFEVNAGGTGSGELNPAAKVKVDDKGSVVTEDYGAEVVRLTNASTKK